MRTIFLVVGLSLPLATLCGQHNYRVRSIGVLPGYDGSVATAMNNTGLVVGYAFTMHGNYHGFLYNINSCTLSDLGSLGSGNSRPNGINDSGLAVGEATTASGPRAFASWLGVMVDLGGTGEEEHALGVNNSGLIVGFEEAGLVEYAAEYESRPVRLPGPVLVLDPRYVNHVGRATAVNDYDQVVGVLQLDVTTYLAMIYYPDLGKWYQIRPVAPEAGGFGLELATYPKAVNRYGHVTGAVGNIPWQHAFLSQAFYLPTQDLGTLNPADLGTVSSGAAINSNGWVVGDSTKVTGGDGLAFLYDGSSMIDLNTRLIGSPGWQLVSARAINDSGQIAGRGIHNGRTEAFVLLPQFHIAQTVDFCGTTTLP